MLGLPDTSIEVATNKRNHCTLAGSHLAYSLAFFGVVYALVAQYFVTATSDNMCKDSCDAELLHGEPLPDTPFLLSSRIAGVQWSQQCLACRVGAVSLTMYGVLAACYLSTMTYSLVMSFLLMVTWLCFSSERINLCRGFALARGTKKDMHLGLDKLLTRAHGVHVPRGSQTEEEKKALEDHGKFRSKLLDRVLEDLHDRDLLSAGAKRAISEDWAKSGEAGPSIPEEVGRLSRSGMRNLVGAVDFLDGLANAANPSGSRKAGPSAPESTTLLVPVYEEAFRCNWGQHGNDSPAV